MIKKILCCIHINVVIIMLLALYFFIIPGGILLHDLRDPGLYINQMPAFTFRWHNTLSKKYERYCRQRIVANKAASLNISDVSGTEWPLCGTVFYLWSTESLQDAWEKDHDFCPVMPKEYAKDAIEASVDLLTDPAHATWVKKKWGEDYLHHENLFYRMLLIAGLTSYQKLTNNKRYQSLLTNQVESLSKELDESPFGLLDDYPGECYPVDILPAIAVIKRADKILGSDHSQFIQRAQRGFQGNVLDKKTGLPAYNVYSKSGDSLGSARGVGISFMLIWAAESWEDVAKEWYSNYERYFWQEKLITAGFREFPKSMSDMNWLLEIDAGPIIAGYGIGANAFGIGAARANGRFDHAYTLGTQALVLSWPLIDGTFLTARLLSDSTEAPYLGEAAMLFTFTRQLTGNKNIVTKKKLPFFVYFTISLYFIAGIFYVVRGVLYLRYWKKNIFICRIPLPHIQLFIWFMLVLAGSIIFIFSKKYISVLFLFSALFLPRGIKSKAIQEDKL